MDEGRKSVCEIQDGLEIRAVKRLPRKERWWWGGHGRTTKVLNRSSKVTKGFISAGRSVTSSGSEFLSKIQTKKTMVDLSNEDSERT